MTSIFIYISDIENIDFCFCYQLITVQYRHFISISAFVSRDVRLLDNFISGFRAFTVEFSSGSRRGARGRGARKSLIFRPK